VPNSLTGCAGSTVRLAAGGAESMRASRMTFGTRSPGGPGRGRAPRGGRGRAGAVRAYRHYLLLRAAPEPALRAEAECVRAELARIESGPPRR